MDDYPEVLRDLISRPMVHPPTMLVALRRSGLQAAVSQPQALEVLDAAVTGTPAIVRLDASHRRVAPRWAQWLVGGNPWDGMPGFRHEPVLHWAVLVSYDASTRHALIAAADGRLARVPLARFAQRYRDGGSLAIVVQGPPALNPCLCQTIPVSVSFSTLHSKGSHSSCIARLVPSPCSLLSRWPACLRAAPAPSRRLRPARSLRPRRECPTSTMSLVPRGYSNSLHLILDQVVEGMTLDRDAEKEKLRGAITLGSGVCIDLQPLV